MAKASKGLTRRTNWRLARLRASGENVPGVKPNRYTVSQAVAIKKATRELQAKERSQKKAKKNAPVPYNPLAPLTGKREQQEEAAAVRSKYGQTEQQLRNAVASQRQGAANTGSYYDDYKRALEASSAQIQAANAANVAAAEGRTDTAYAQDKAAVEAKDKAMAESAQARGITPTASEEGRRAVEAQRSQQNQQINELRGRSGAETTAATLRSATSVQAKAEALGREAQKLTKLQQEQRNLSTEKGDYAVEFRNKQRESERQWAAVQKEFDIKEQDLALKNKTSKTDAQVERAKVEAQKIVAKLYSDANKAKARATIRVAKLQLKKGKIDQHQFNTIKNIYEGLPDKGYGYGKGGGPKSKGTKLQTWEKDKIENAIEVLKSHNVTRAQEARAMRNMTQNAGMPPRLARIAWRKYIHRYGGNPNIPAGKK